MMCLWAGGVKAFVGPNHLVIGLIERRV
jgi:hypothetical protein